MKLEMNRAWNGTVRLLRQNREVVLVIAGAFFFLPYLAFMLIAPDPWAGVSSVQAPDADAMVARLSAFYAQVWWVIALILLVQAAGMLSLLALLSDRRRPTVGEALRIGARKVLPYIAAYLIMGMALAIALTSGMAWGYYWKMGRFDFVVTPVTIALAFGVAQFVPNGWRPLIALVFVVAALLAAAWLRQRLSRPAN